MNSIEKQCAEKFANVLKFVSFTNKNSLFPFTVKKTVLDAAVLTSIFYGCESWLTNNLKSATTTYMSLVKTLLGVRRTTSNDTCLIELGLPTAKAFVQNVQFKFFTRMIASRAENLDDPFTITLNLCKDAKTPCWRYLNSVLGKENIIDADLMETKTRLRHAGPERTKLRTYLDLNPDLVVNPIYSDLAVNELQRIKVTRLRLSSHNLKIETGRWSRIPREQRTCLCGEVQTEQHVICDCELTRACRNDRQFNNLNAFFQENPTDICAIVNSSLQIFGL